MGATLLVACAVSLICCTTISEAVVSSEYFLLNVDSNGQHVCVNGVPSKEQFVRSKSECALACVAQKECLQYNYFKSNSKCQLFYNNPTSLAKTVGCTSYRNMRIFPGNKVVLTGDKVILGCKSSSPIGLWTFTPVDDSTAVPIVKDCAVLEPFSAHYAVITSDGGCNLLINNVKMNQSGTYACRVEQSPEFFASAEVVVLQSKPECTTNVTNGSVMAFEWLELTCVANISKRGELLMSCQNAIGSPIGIPGVTTDKSISIYVKVGGPPVLQPFECTVKATVGSVPVIEGCHASNNTKDYVYNWTLPTVNILCLAGFDFVAGACGCYRPIIELLNWATASARCQNFYNAAYSVIITSEDEQSAIGNYLNARMNGTCYFAPSYGSGFFVWTAGQRQNSSYSSPFVWKPKAIISLPFAYTNWNVREPSCVPGYNEYCLMMIGTVSYTWYDNICIDKLCALCEYGPY